MKKKKENTSTFQESVHMDEVIRLLSSIDSKLSSMVYYQDPKTGGFAPAIEKAIGQTFIDEGTNRNLSRIIKQEIRNVLGEQINGNNFRNR